MSKLHWFMGLLAVGVCAGCGNSDIVVTDRLKMLEHKCVHVSPIQSEDPHVGQVIKEVLIKEFVRKNVDLCEKKCLEAKIAYKMKIITIIAIS